MTGEYALSDSEVRDLLGAADGPEWTLHEGRLVKRVQCRGFSGSLSFVMAVGALAETADHHPDIDIRFDSVILTLVSHDVGGITDRDLELARSIDGVAAGC